MVCLIGLPEEVLQGSYQAAQRSCSRGCGNADAVPPQLGPAAAGFYLSLTVGSTHLQTREIEPNLRPLLQDLGLLLVLLEDPAEDFQNGVPVPLVQQLPADGARLQTQPDVRLQIESGKWAEKSWV